MLTTNYLTTSQSEECPQGDGVLLFTVKLLTTTLQVGTHNFEGVGLLWPPTFAWQSNKAILFYFTQNSEIQLCMLVYRSQISASAA